MTIFDNNHSFPTNAQPSILTRLSARIVPLLGECKNRYKARKSLSNISEKDLRDIGLTRFDIESSSKLPLSRDAAAELNNIANTRAGNW